MALSEKDVRGIAEYAKIALTDDELTQMTSYLNDAVAGWQAAGRRFYSETAPSIAKAVLPTTKTVPPTTKSIPSETKSITTFDAFRQNRDFHRML